MTHKFLQQRHVNVRLRSGAHVKFMLHMQAIPMTTRRREFGSQRLADCPSSHQTPSLTLAQDGLASMLPLILSMSLRCEIEEKKNFHFLGAPCPVVPALDRGVLGNLLNSHLFCLCR